MRFWRIKKFAFSKSINDYVIRWTESRSLRRRRWRERKRKQTLGHLNRIRRRSIMRWPWTGRSKSMMTGGPSSCHWRMMREIKWIKQLRIENGFWTITFCNASQRSMIMRRMKVILTRPSVWTKLSRKKVDQEWLWAGRPSLPPTVDTWVSHASLAPQSKTTVTQTITRQFDCKYTTLNAKCN